MRISNFQPPFDGKPNEIWLDKIDTWESFEDLCLDLATCEYNIIGDIRKYGTRGQNQQGIDIYYLDKDGKYNTLQCKNVRKFSPQKILNAVDEFLNGSFKEKCKLFILCARDYLHNTEAKQQAINEQAERLLKLGIEFLVWDYYGLNLRLKKHPKLVGNFFGAEWVRVCGTEAYDAYKAFYKPSLPTPIKKYYEAVDKYIPRKISSTKYNNDKTFFNETEGISLLEKLNQQKDGITNKYILLSEGGYGKSTELDYLAHYYSKDASEKFYPIRVKLRNTVEGESIETILSNHFSNWEGIPNGKLLVLFDGLDEVNLNEYENLIKRVNTFTEKEKDRECTILISSRTNYFQSSNGNNQLNNFETLHLNELSIKDINDFLQNELEEETERFHYLINEYRFKELLLSPFYLIALVQIFKKERFGEGFPKSKRLLLERIIEIEYEAAIEKFAMTKVDLVSNKNLIYSLLEKIAFAMIYIGKNNLTVTELSRLFPNDNDRILLKHSILNYENERFQFSHNMVQEYLASNYLCKLDFLKIKKLVSFKPSHDKIKSKWLNTISFLLSSLSKNDVLLSRLIEWITKCEPEVLIKMERDKFSRDLRYTIVENIITKYKEMGVHTSRHYFYEEDLAKFEGCSKKLLMYCKGQLDNTATPVETKILCTHLIKQYSIFFGLENELKTTLLKNVYTHVEMPYLQEQSIKALVRISDYINIADCFDLIVNNTRNIENLKLRNGILVLTSELEIEIKHLDFAIETINILNNTGDGMRTYGEEKPIEDIFLKCKSPVLINKVLGFLGSDFNLIVDSYSKRISFDKDFLKKIIEIATNTYNDDNKIFYLIIDLIKKLEYKYSMHNYHEIINPFFKVTGTVTKAFNYFYDDYKSNPTFSWEKVKKLMFFASKANLKKMFDEYKRGIVNADCIFWCRNILNKTETKKLHDWFYNLINEQEPGAFLYIEEKPFDWEEHKKNQRIRDQELLLNRTEFLLEIKNIFKIAGKKKLTIDDLVDYKKQYIHDEDKLNNTLIIPLLRDWAIDKPFIDYSTLEEAYIAKNERWREYVINEIVRILTANNDVVDELKQFAIKFINDKLKTIDLKKSISDTSDNGYTYSYFSVWLNLFCEKWDLDFPQNILLDMLHTDHHSVNENKVPEITFRASDFVCRKINNNALVRKQVISNLKKGGLAKPVLGSHFYLCKTLDIVDARGFLYQELIGNKFSEYAKPEILKIFVKLGGEISELYDDYMNYDKVDNWFWHLTNTLIVEYQTEICNQLIKLLQEPNIEEEDKVNASLKLLRNGKYEGVVYFCEYIKTYNEVPYDYYFAQEVLGKDLPYKKSLDLIFRYLMIPFHNKAKGIYEKPFERIDDAMYSLILSIALQSETAYEYAVKKYKEFITKNKDKFETVKNIYYPLTHLQNQYFINKEEKLEIEDFLKLAI